MRHSVYRLIALAAALSLSSCISCYPVRMTQAEMASAGLTIGTVVEAKRMLYASLEKDIDGGPNVVYVTEEELYKKHYVLRQFTVSRGTRFEFIGFLRPRNFLCSSIYGVLRPIVPIEPTGAEVNIRMEETPDGTFAFDPEMFVEVKRE